MSCHYIYRGHRFESELELDDFLLEQGQFISTQGDAVFSQSMAQTVSINRVERIKDETRKILDKKQRFRIYGEEEFSYGFKKDSKIMGVNKFTSQYRTEDGRRLHPEFEEEEFFNEKKEAWSQGQFTDEEKELFNITDGRAITDEPVQNKMIATIKNKWEHQCIFGDAVHAVFELYFSKTKDNVYFKDYLDSDAEIKNQFIEKLSKTKWKRKDGSGYISFTDVIDDTLLNNILEKCKQFDKKLVEQFGEGCEYFPELEITGEINKEYNGCTTLHGIIDLLVIDAQGNPHIIDYKTSIKPYEKFDSAKKLAFRYQLAIYGRMLEKAGFRITTNPYNIVPIQLMGFESTGSDSYKFSGIEFPIGVFRDIQNDVNSINTLSNLEEFMSTPMRTNVEPDKILEKTNDIMTSWMPGYEQRISYDRDGIISELEEDGCLAGPREDYQNKWVWKKGYLKDPIVTADSKEELIEKALAYRKKLPILKQKSTQNVINRLKEGQQLGSSEVNWPEQSESKSVGVNRDWFKHQLSKYCNDNWTVLDGVEFAPLTQLGIILLQNENTRQIDVIKISNNNLKRPINFGKDRNTLLGSRYTDYRYASRQNNLMLEANNGNIEMIETLVVLNQLEGLFAEENALIGNIQVMDPHTGQGIGASNKELDYCFKELCEIDETKKFENFENNIGKTIKFASKAHLARTEFLDIMKLASDHEFRDIYSGYKDFNSCKDQLNSCIECSSIEDKLKALTQLKSKLEEEYKGTLITIKPEQEILSRPEVRIYNQVLLAIAELRGIDFRQQLSDHSKWCQLANKGLHGTYMDNPGNLQSETLNLLTKMTTEAYQNVRDDMVEPTAKLRQLTENLKRDKGFNKILEVTVGNQASIYQNMYRESDLKEGDLVFKNPWTDVSLSQAEKDYLIYVLDKINRNRYAGKTDNYYQDMIDSDAYDYFKVPLCKGDTSSFSAQKGLMNAIKHRLKEWMPSQIMIRVHDELGDVSADSYDTENEKARRSRENLFEMTNRFDRGEENIIARKEYIINRGGPEYFENNLETLALKHIFAYSMKQRVDDVMPNIKAALIHLTMQGAVQNTVFENDLQYGKNYIRNKIKNESIVDPGNEKKQAYFNKLKSVASMMTLGFSPKQWIYQTIQGIWNDISLLLRRPDGTNAFTFKNMFKAAITVYRELFNWGDKPSVMKLLNEQYGINDMDMNTYIERLKSDHSGIFNFQNAAFKFASRPDFYNRMTIFASQMLNDDSLKAHEVVDGQLVYNWKKDGRFSAFANDDKSDIKKYNEQRALYFAMAKQFEIEKAKVKINGEWIDFKLDMNNRMPLPKAYTNLEAESMKSLGDTIYGYYSHEKKSMVQSTLIGGMWMQFRTYWSGVKNRYVGGGAVRLEGHWEQYSENGVNYYYQIDDTGKIKYDLPPITQEQAEKTDNGLSAPVMIWKGDWKEGVVKTYIDLFNNIKEYGLLEGWKTTWYDEDGNTRAYVRSNIIQLWYDMGIFMFVGRYIAGALNDWYKEDKKESDKDDLSEQIALSVENLLIQSLKNSTMDFYIIDSLLQPLEDWSPFSFTYYLTVLKNLFNGLLSDNKADKMWDTLLKTTTVGKQFKPALDTLKPWSNED